MADRLDDGDPHAHGTLLTRRESTVPGLVRNRTSSTAGRSGGPRFPTA
jgi:hypothetical protein